MADPAIYTRCPKCRHSPLPQDQALPAACPACGLILAKFALPLPRTPVAMSVDVPQTTPSRWQGHIQALFEAVRYIPPRVDPALLWARVGLLLLFTLWGLRLIWLDFRIGEMGGSFLHGPLLVFHEAGHVIFGLFGQFIAVLGGTLGQLLMPAILCGAMLVHNRDPFGAAIGLWLVGVSLLDVAPYVFDALQPQLVLLGGHTGEEGGHDWIYLLGETGLLKRAQSLGWLVHKVGAGVILLSIFWAGWILSQQKKRLEHSLQSESDD